MRDGEPGAFARVWSGAVGDIWSVLAGTLPEAEAQGWAITFQLALAGEVRTFSLAEPLSIQIGRALLAHVGPALPDGPLPSEPRATVEATLAALPPRQRLAYLCDLYLHVEPADDAVLRLMEPSLHTDARRTAAALLGRTAPAALSLQPTPRPPIPQRHWGVVAGVAGVLGVLLVGAMLYSPEHTWADWARGHSAALASPSMILGSDPAVLAVALARSGVRTTLIELPDLTPEGLTLVGATHNDAVLTVIYSSPEGFWTLQHTLEALPGEGNHGDAERDVIGWRDAGGSWVFCGPGGRGERIVAALRARRG